MPAGITPPAAPGTPGLTVGGVKCGPGIRQVPWSAYAPECVPAWHGQNGGATSPGVSRSTITITYRLFSSRQLQVIYSMIPSSMIGTTTEQINALRSEIKVFNKNFELYGRQVVLKPFQGQGDFLQEMTGGGMAQAEADAATAQDLGAFADMSMSAGSEYYDRSLMSKHIITFPLSFVQTSEATRQEQPYAYTQGPDCTKLNTAIAALAGRTMVGFKATFAGDTSLQSKVRSFGLVNNIDPVEVSCADGLISDLATYGIHLANRSQYNYSASSAIEQFTTIVERMKELGVTTIIDDTADPITPGLLMSIASSIGYHPEWILVSTDVGGFENAELSLRAFDREAPAEMTHMLAVGLVSEPATSQEDYKVVQMAATGQKPLPSYTLGWTYAPVVLFFSALQQAGPDLTPQTFDRGFHSLMDSKPNGMFGQWTFGNDLADPASTFQIVHWDPTAISNLDGARGALVACNRGQHYSYQRAATQIPHDMLDCG